MNVVITAKFVVICYTIEKKYTFKGGLDRSLSAHWESMRLTEHGETFVHRFVPCGNSRTVHCTLNNWSFWSIEFSLFSFSPKHE